MSLSGSNAYAVDYDYMYKYLLANDSSTLVWRRSNGTPLFPTDIGKGFFLYEDSDKNDHWSYYILRIGDNEKPVRIAHSVGSTRKGHILNEICINESANEIYFEEGWEIGEIMRYRIHVVNVSSLLGEKR